MKLLTANSSPHRIDVQLELIRIGRHMSRLPYNAERGGAERRRARQPGRMLACTYRPVNTSRLLIAQGQLAECGSHGQTRLKENVQGQPKPESYQFSIRM